MKTLFAGDTVRDRELADRRISSPNYGCRCTVIDKLDNVDNVVDNVDINYY